MWRTNDNWTQTEFNSLEKIFENYLKINFKLIEELGIGSYGEVFKVQKLMKDSNEKFFAIKKIKFRAEYEKKFLNEL